MIFIRILIVLVLIFSMKAVPCLAGETDPKVEAEIMELMERHAEAFGKKDLSAIMEMYAKGRDTVFMGTGPGERWVGREERVAVGC